MSERKWTERNQPPLKKRKFIYANFHGAEAYSSDEDEYAPILSNKKFNDSLYMNVHCC